MIIRIANFFVVRKTATRQGRIGCRGLREEDRLTTPAMITVAITGSVPRKKDTPAIPVTPAEQIESTHAAYEAGATVVHIHVRDAEENASSDPELFAQVQRSEEHTSELQSLMRLSYAVFGLNKKTNRHK